MSSPKGDRHEKSTFASRVDHVPAVSSGFEERVRSVISRLRPGDVVTYGEVAEEAGFPGAARAVGNILARSEGLPWWRIVSSTGRLVPGHERAQAERLRSEGVLVVRGRVRPGRTIVRHRIGRTRSKGA